MPSDGTLNLKTEIQDYGVPARNFRHLGGAVSSDLLDYLDLLPREDDAALHTNDLMPDGVVESQDRPLLFIVNESRLARAPAEQETQVKTLRRKLACRGDRAYLARVRPGELAVVPVSLDDQAPDWVRYTPGTPEALTFFSRLAYSLIQKLTEALAANRKEPIPISSQPECCSRSNASPLGEQVAISRHKRSFNYIENNLPAGTIVIRHLWLKRGSA